MKDRFTISKALLLLTVMVCSAFAMAQSQDPCEITCETAMPVCSGTEIKLEVGGNGQYMFQWYKENMLLAGQTRNSLRTTVSRPAGDDSGEVYEIEYSVKVYNPDSTLFCNPTFVVGVKPLFRINFRQVKLTCSNRAETNGHTAQVIASVDSTSVAYAPPFEYAWRVPPLHLAFGDGTMAVGLEAYKYYFIDITDSRGCKQTDSITLKAYPNPLVEISTDPGDTVYLQNPHVTYSFENLSADSIPLSNFYWILNSTYNITSTELEPRFTYVETGSYITELKVYNPQGCDTTYMDTIQVEPVKLKIPNVFTPNGDGVNDYFIIAPDTGGDSGGDNGSGMGGSDRGRRQSTLEYENYEPLNRYYESSELTIFNRWGRVVYHSKDYQNNWDGGGLPDGTYFYVLKCHGLKQDANYQGSVMIITAQRQ